MPKETISPRHHGTDQHPAPRVTVGWSRDASDVQIGVAPMGRVVPDAGPTTTLTINDAIRADLEFADKHRVPGGKTGRWSNGSNYAEHLDTVLLVAEQGWFADLDRDGINRLIRLLRKARDAAFGADA